MCVCVCVHVCMHTHTHTWQFSLHFIICNSFPYAVKYCWQICSLPCIVVCVCLQMLLIYIMITHSGLYYKYFDFHAHKYLYFIIMGAQTVCLLHVHVTWLGTGLRFSGFISASPSECWVSTLGSIMNVTVTLSRWFHTYYHPCNQKKTLLNHYGILHCLQKLKIRDTKGWFFPSYQNVCIYKLSDSRHGWHIQFHSQKHMAESANVLYQLLRCITCIGLVIVVFGQSYSHLLLYLYGGESLIMGPGPTLMRTHCLAVLLLAINGITECYAFATMNTAQLDKWVALSASQMQC
jgi:hypothetical protein